MNITPLFCFADASERFICDRWWIKWTEIPFGRGLSTWKETRGALPGWEKYNICLTTTPVTNSQVYTTYKLDFLGILRLHPPDILAWQRWFSRSWNEPSERPSPLYHNHTSWGVLHSCRTFPKTHIFILYTSQCSSTCVAAVSRLQRGFHGLKSCPNMQKSTSSFRALSICLEILLRCLTSLILVSSFEAFSQPPWLSPGVPHRRPLSPICLNCSSEAALTHLLLPNSPRNHDSSSSIGWRNKVMWIALRAAI